MSIVVRDATAVEFDLMKRAALESGIYTGPNRDAPLAASAKFRSLNQARARVAIASGQVTGFCGVVLPSQADADEAQLDFLLVHGHWRGRGLGARLLADTCSVPGRAGAVRIRVVAHPALERFYLSAGAYRIGTEPPRPHHSWYCPVLALKTQAEALSFV